MNLLKHISHLFVDRCRDIQFLEGLQWFFGVVSKILAVGMAVVILVMLVELSVYLVQALLSGEPFLITGVTEIFGIFLSVLIALELLENITAYLRRHVVQIELVIGTSLIAVARKIIILDFDKVDGLDLIGLALVLVALSISYWVVRRTHRISEPDNQDH